ncbi:MAG: hypothetical protein P8P29_04730, partial [Flavobacteriaceae bacterium]|nr:hypothetical protein [Flavobacteriaceae bacterium]
HKLFFNEIITRSETQLCLVVSQKFAIKIADGASKYRQISLLSIWQNKKATMPTIIIKIKSNLLGLLALFLKPPVKK